MNNLKDIIKKHFGSETNLVKAMNERFDLNLATGHVYYWKTQNLPLTRAKQMVKVSNGKLQLIDLRPDLYE